MLNKTKIEFHKNETSKSTIEFSDQYHKSRRNLILFSGILFGLTFAGFKIIKSVQKSFEKEISNTDVFVSIENPEVIQYILVILIIYFWYRFIIEWNLADNNTRKNVSAKIDHYISQFIGFISLSSFYLQKLMNYRLVDIIDKYFIGSLILSVYIGEIAGLFYQKIKMNGFQFKIFRLSYLANFILSLIFVIPTAYCTFVSRYPVITSTMVLLITCSSFIIFSKTKVTNIFYKRLINASQKRKLINRLTSNSS